MSAEALEFCDTNVLVYAYDPVSGDKHWRAKALLERLWESGRGIVSVQVLGELYVTLTRKVEPKVSPAVAQSVVVDFSNWRVVEPTAREVLDAIELSIRHSVSYWDALIIAAARRAGATTVWSEDLVDGQDYEGVTVRNPLK